ncbi:type III secretion system translocon subunit SctE [Pseudomonas sp. IPO3774]|uniref:type III secretion system translocon subunit SctE n=1 Tax=Pseudomonas sp. IPO3774 TaxID=2738826 RepID=UPI001C433D27|nr:type III secretion system translocon subunit SctE [Pseudomonas sp. IPO3774]
MTAITGMRPWQGGIPAVLSVMQDGEKEKVAATKRQALSQELLAQTEAAKPSWLRLSQEAKITRQEANEVFGRLFRNADKDVVVLNGEIRPSVMPPAHAFEKMSVELMMVAATLTAGELMGHITDAKAKAIRILGDQQDKLRTEELKEFREQIDNALEQQKKAKKAGVFGVIFDWVVAAVQVVTGVAKMVGGALTGNVMTAAGGAMDLMAGLAGVVKATMNTMALIDTANADKYRKIADVAAKVQLTFEIAGAAIDFLSAARNLITTKVIPQATKAVLKEGADQALSQAIKKGSKSAATEIAEQVGKQVADQVSDNLMRSLGKTALEASKSAGKDVASKVVQQLGVNQMLEKFSREAIESLVTDAVKKVANNAIDKGVEMSAKQLTKAIHKEVVEQVALSTMKASTYIGINAAREAVGGAQKITAGVLAMERAQLQKEIDQLVLDQQWLMMLVDMFERDKEQQVEEMKRLTEGQTDALAGASDVLRDAAQTRVRAATSMAGVAVHAV